MSEVTLFDGATMVGGEFQTRIKSVVFLPSNLHAHSMQLPSRTETSYSCVNLGISPAFSDFPNLASQLPRTKWQEGAKLTEVSTTHTSKNRRMCVHNPPREGGQLSTENIPKLVLQKDPRFRELKTLRETAN